MFMEFDRPVVRQRNEELMHEARRWHLQGRLRASRKESLGTRPRVDNTTTGTGVIHLKALALNLLGLRRNSYGSTPR